ncbi:hypothetical protein TPA0910_77500 [Streptomyces hygroscopicus subsp. sporocinereus]|uniref:Uncharacterized protein n=1 Tax=Streptomyces hygroscopicus TaxID=1912 RepID=A0ABQ3UCH9_STRHY|nr:hypothetical protein TPA0910_77500 [Streptomyces hygroscopicus]
MAGDRMAAELEFVGESHEVELESDEASDTRAGPRVAGHVLASVALVTRGVPDLVRGLAEECGDGHARLYPQPQRHHVGHGPRKPFQPR